LKRLEGFSFVTPVTGLNKSNTGKEVDNDDIALTYTERGLLHKTDLVTHGEQAADFKITVFK
jgi:hypothetical protein